ncbi:TIGR02594 family protein [Bradyrhizobium sp. KBS0727]|uniref:TIGR02594 family protein n=1 Tax=unclassified Bradyrhizobium TaxID=2631580 RepID=UPI00110EB0AF|nr:MULTISPECIES: TIGR02594 family protein [unclassified Bradyrhizobium]QDW36478.1 TIGR02594 family protein [Bradyrhizobium sp. KBS0725]QDW43077.1 TIGR02594 family protein [Bradyrhizobium sp. KBS0727]
MFQLLAFRRSLRVLALALCSASIAVSVTPAHARSHHGAGRHARAYHAGHHARRHYVHVQRRHVADASRWERGVAQMRAGGFADTKASLTTDASASAPASFGSSNVVAEARRYIGGNPTGRGSLWCARFMNMVLQHTGHHGTGSDMASSFAHYGQRVSGPQVGAIAVMGRRGGGHVGIITGIDAAGNPIMISGNNGNRVREAPISRGRIYAYVMPTG